LASFALFFQQFDHFVPYFSFYACIPYTFGPIVSETNRYEQAHAHRNLQEINLGRTVRTHARTRPMGLIELPCRAFGDVMHLETSPSRRAALRQAALKALFFGVAD
jgi:hypothetical protein